MARESFRILTLTFVLILLAGAVPAREPTPEEREILERVRALRQEIEELLARLPPELRDTANAPPKDTPAAAEPKPPPAPEPKPPPSPEPKPPPEPPRRPACVALAAFDTNGDEVLDARDRYWRYLDLWIDRDGNGRIDEREIVSPYDQKIEKIAADLEWFEGRRISYGQIRLGEHLVLDLRGDGFGDRGDGVLVVDAGDLRRGGGPSLLAADGTALEGVTPLGRGLVVVVEGRRRALDCR